MWSTCAAKRTHLSLPLRLNNPPPERDTPPPAAPRSAELRPMLHLTLRTAPAAQEKTVEKKEETEKDRPATQLASKARPDAGHESSNRHAPTYHLVVYVRGARNLPLDKCESCSGFSQMLDLRAWRLDVRCQVGVSLTLKKKKILAAGRALSGLSLGSPLVALRSALS